MVAVSSLLATPDDLVLYEAGTTPGTAAAYSNPFSITFTPASATPGIFAGDAPITTVYAGDTPIKAIYADDVLIWDDGT